MTTPEAGSIFGPSLDELSDLEMQTTLLGEVSRTFAMTIPELPEELFTVVANAYLLCRTVDTIEDEVSLPAKAKREFCRRFIGVVKNTENAVGFSTDLHPLLSQQTIPAEHELIDNIDRVIGITHSFPMEQQAAIVTCIETMAGGMPEFQDLDLHCGLKTMADMDRYCYFVAGCVGEMLSKLFCSYSPEIAQHQQRMLELSVSFGQGLQMTNILKDIWDDHRRSVCWLPQDKFKNPDFNLAELVPGHNSPAFRKGLEQMLAITHIHLRNALEYTLLIPKTEIGIRYFCLWALGMAVLTLKEIKANLNFSAPNQVKISRRAVKSTVLATRLAGRSDLALRALFSITSYGLKTDKNPEIFTR